MIDGMESTFKRRTQGDRRRDARAAAKVGVVHLVSVGSETDMEGGRPCSSIGEEGATEGFICVPEMKEPCRRCEVKGARYGFENESAK